MNLVVNIYMITDLTAIMHEFMDFIYAKDRLLLRFDTTISILIFNLYCISYLIFNEYLYVTSYSIIYMNIIYNI